MTTEPQRRKAWQILPVILILGLLIATIWYYFSIFDRLSGENVQTFIGGFGVWAPLVYVVLYIVSAPIPFGTLILSPLGGLLFGPLWGAVLVIGVATLSSTIPFLMARQLGRDWVASKLKGGRLKEIYRHSEGQGGFVFVLMMRLIPVLPWEVQNYVAGLTKIPIPSYVVATAVGIIPGSTALVLLGDAITDPRSWQFAAAIGLNVAVMVAAPLVASYLRRRRDRHASSAAGDLR